MDGRYVILKELSTYPKRKKLSDRLTSKIFGKNSDKRYKMGRAIKESDLPYLEDLFIMGYIDAGFNYKTGEGEISITSLGDLLAKSV